MSQLKRELVAAGVPAMAGRPGGRIALGGAFKTETGQWAIEADGTTLWHGTGDPTTEPNAVLLAQVATVRSAHVPDPPPPLPIDQREVLRLLVKKARGRVLTQAQDDLLDRVEGQDP